MSKIGDFEEKRFKTMNDFHKKASNEDEQALATIKCEPTWFMNGKQYMLYESCPSAIETIEKSLKMKQIYYEVLCKIEQANDMREVGKILSEVLT